MKKTCYKCKLEKALDEFSKNASKSDGRNSCCRACYSLYKKGYYRQNENSIKANVSRRRENLREWFEKYKSGLKCEQCGDDHPAVLDFHHTGGKDFEIADAVKNGLSIARIIAEIKKCKVLCCRCHRILHWEERMML